MMFFCRRFKEFQNTRIFYPCFCITKVKFRRKWSEAHTPCCNVTQDSTCFLPTTLFTNTKHLGTPTKKNSTSNLNFTGTENPEKQLALNSLTVEKTVW